MSQSIPFVLRRLSLVVLWVTALVASGCDVIPDQSDLSTIVPSAQTSGVVTVTNPSMEVTATAAPMSPTAVGIAPATPIPLAISSATPEHPCTGQSADASVPEMIQGGLAVLDPATSSVELLTLPGGALTDLQTKETVVYEAVVSPSGRFIALHNASVESDRDQSLEIRDRSGAVIRTVRWPREWTSLSGWLDDDQIVVHQQDETQSERSLGYHYVVINPSTGATVGEILPPPDVYTLPPLPNWQFWQTYVPNSSREFAAYLREVDGVAWAYAVWSYESNSLLTETRTFNNLVKPEWSPVATEVAIAYSGSIGDSSVRDEIYAIDSQGTTQRLTHLGEAYRTTFIQSLRWSPKGDKIAFWLNTGMNETTPDDNYGPQALMVLDLASRQILDLCVEGDANTNFRHKTVPAPYWSADGSYLLVENRKSESDSRLLVVDVKDGHAYQVGAQLIPLGWMAEP